MQNVISYSAMNLGLDSPGKAAAAVLCALYIKNCNTDSEIDDSLVLALSELFKC